MICPHCSRTIETGATQSCGIIRWIWDAVIASVLAVAVGIGFFLGRGGQPAIAEAKYPDMPARPI